MTREESLAFLRSVRERFERTPPEVIRARVKELGLESCFEKEQPQWIRCNHCMSIFSEESIDIDALGPGSGETCPVCSKGDALMDIENPRPPARNQGKERICTSILGQN